MVDVFISYAHSDRHEAERLVRALQADNIVGWMDNADIAAGTCSVCSPRRFEAIQRRCRAVITSRTTK